MKTCTKYAPWVLIALLCLALAWHHNPRTAPELFFSFVGLGAGVLAKEPNSHTPALFAWPGGKRSLTKTLMRLKKAVARLQGVLIECRDFAECIQRYDSKDTFFYCDPPYTSFQRNGRYTSLGDRESELFRMLASGKSRFLMSFDDCARIRGLVDECELFSRPVSVNYSLGQKNTTRAKELLIANYAL